MAQGAVIHVQGARPEDVGRVYVEARQTGSDAELVAEFLLVEQAGIQGRRRQVVGGAEGMKVPGEVQVHLLHGHHLGMSAPGGAPLDPEHGPEARLAYGGDAGLADVVEPHGKAEGGDRLALAEGGRGDGAHQHQLASLFGLRLEQVETEFALVVALGAELVGRDGEAFGQRVNGETGGLAGDLDIA
ncbi:hypothetical protein D3C72_1229570 [compost metagenome]